MITVGGGGEFEIAMGGDGYDGVVTMLGGAAAAAVAHVSRTRTQKLFTRTPLPQEAEDRVSGTAVNRG
jgi:hypothetical protein